MTYEHIALLLALWLRGSSVLAQSFPSFSLYKSDDLDTELGASCIRPLTSEIQDCHPYIQQMTTRQYRSSLGNVTATNQLCTSGCVSSLASWFWTVSSNCEGKEIDGHVPQLLGGYMWAGWNETCVRDPRSKDYCNDIIANFTEVDTYRDMPRAELCHTCYARRLAMMQSSQYSVYNEYYKEELEYVYETCGGKGPTALPPPLMVEPPIAAPYCLTGRRYTTVEGDTCESISNATSVSSAVLYMENQELLKDCSQIPAGIVACIPLTCQTYYVRPSDTCVSIEAALEFEFGTLQTYNSWINFDCSNLQPATDFYGKMICVSPQGGSYTGIVPPPAATDPPAHDGYSPEVVSPPDDAPLAEGTTLNCGKWHVVESSDTCATICMQGSITINLFQQVNPSLDAGTSCSNKLKVGTAVCVGPTWDWDIREENEAITSEVERLAFTDLPSLVSEKVTETSTH